MLNGVMYVNAYHDPEDTALCIALDLHLSNTNDETSKYTHTIRNININSPHSQRLLSCGSMNIIKHPFSITMHHHACIHTMLVCCFISILMSDLRATDMEILFFVCSPNHPLRQL